jgi:casein kinase II subunit beta
MEPIIWVDRFLSFHSPQYLVPVPDAFLADFLNRPAPPDVAHFAAAKSLILSASPPNDDPAQPDAEALYGLAHLEFLQTDVGRERLRAKIAAGIFPNCPRLFCAHTGCLPCGVSAELHDNPVMMFCPRCREIYKVGKADICGAFFGTDYIDAMVKRYPELAADQPTPIYVPRIFGFQILEKDALPDSP